MEQKELWPNAVTLLGIIGGEQAAETLISFAEEHSGQVVDPATFRATLDSVLSLGYVVNREPVEEAIGFLTETAQAIGDEEPQAAATEAEFGVEGGLRVTDSMLAHSAVLGLSLSGRPEARAVLEELASQPSAAATGEVDNAEAETLLSDALATHSEVADRGLIEFYQQRQ